MGTNRTTQLTRGLTPLVVGFFFLTARPATAQCVPDLAAGLVGHYTFNGDTLDSSGSGNDGDPEGFPEFAGAVLGGGIVLGNHCTYVHLTENFDLTEDYTITAWINPFVQTPTRAHTIFSMRDQCMDTFRGWTQAQFSLAEGNIGNGVNRTTSCFGGSNGDRYGTLDHDIPSGCFSHVALRVENNSQEDRVVELFVNGELCASMQFQNADTSSVFSPVRMYESYIGVRAPELADLNIDPNGARFFNGIIDDFRVYDRTLLDCEVELLFEQGGLEDQDANGVLDACEAGGECCDPCELALLLQPLTSGASGFASTDPCFGFEEPAAPSPLCCEALNAIVPSLPGIAGIPATHPCFVLPPVEAPSPVDRSLEPRPRGRLLR